MKSPAPSSRLARSGRERTLITPEGIALPLTLASRVTRAGALLLDMTFIVLLIMVATIVLIFIAGGMAVVEAASQSKGATALAVQFLIVIYIAAIFLFRNAYFLFFELGPKGATPGKRITGIRIASCSGGRLTAEMVIARNLLRDIELFLPLVFLRSASDGGDMGIAGLAATAWFLIFALFPCFNRDRLRAGDLIAGTWVVEAPKPKLERAMSVSPSPDAPKPESTIAFTEAELSAYGEYELQTLEKVLRENRMEAMEQVHQAICRKIGRQAYWGQERAFLDAYYTQLRARLESGMRMGMRKADKFAGSA